MLHVCDVPCIRRVWDATTEAEEHGITSMKMRDMVVTEIEHVR